MKIRSLLTGVFILVVFALPGAAQAPPSVPYDHIHLAAPDPDKAYDWYLRHLDGQPGETPGRVIFEAFNGKRPLPVQLIFLRVPDAKPSEGSVIESIGFSVPDVAGKTKELEAAGARVVSSGVVVDPWGTKIELVNDVPGRGFHHVTLRVADPDATLRWFVSNFGGARTKMGGRDALRYGRTYLVLTTGAAAPSQGRSIDHLGFGPLDMNTTSAALRAQGVKFTAEPAAAPNQVGHRTGYVEAPGGIRIELVEHAKCEWGKAAE